MNRNVIMFAEESETRDTCSSSAMSRAFVVSQQKLAEKLTILKDRGIGMLTRIYNIKKGTLIVF